MDLWYWAMLLVRCFTSKGRSLLMAVRLSSGGPASPEGIEQLLRSSKA